jgi:hypothetical protein
MPVLVTEITRTRCGRTKYGFGAPAMRCLLRATIGGAVFQLGSEGTWQENPGPVQWASIYEGVWHNALLETPGWDAPGYVPPKGVRWTPAVLGNASGSSWKLRPSTRLASAVSLPAVRVTHTLTSNRIQEPAPGVWVFDFVSSGHSLVVSNSPFRSSPLSHLPHRLPVSQHESPTVLD